jgi:hypothetical protein
MERSDVVFNGAPHMTMTFPKRHHWDLGDYRD